jgi:hypothetical protein
MWLWLACAKDPGDGREPEPEPPGPAPTTPTEDDPTAGDTTDTGISSTGPQSVLQFDGPRPTNLLIVSLDTTRRDFIGRYAQNGNTPFLDSLLAEGVVLENHRSCSSWTGPSMTCVTTGRTPFDLGWFPWNSDPEVPDWAPKLPTIAGQLGYQLGFNTTLVTANGVMGPYLPLDRGFEVVLNIDYSDATTVTDTGLEELRKLVSERDPFYLHVHYMDPHAPYCPPDEYIDDPGYEPDTFGDLCDSFGDFAYQFPYQSEQQQDQFLLNSFEVYDAELDYWDVEFRRFWTEADARGALDDTLVVFVTDHGEQFAERGGFGHGLTLASEENRSTAMFWAKNLRTQVWTDPTVHEDIGATLISYFGTVPPEPATGIEVGLAPSDRVVRSMLYWGCCGAAQLSVLRGGLQLTYDFWGEKHLWDFSRDPSGTVDYYDPEDPDVVALWVDMQAYIDELLARWPSAGPPYDPGP